MPMVKIGEQAEDQLEELRDLHWGRPTKKSVVETALDDLHEKLTEEDSR